MRNGQVLILIAALALTGGCAKRIIEINAAISERQSLDSHFYAYATPLPPTDPERVALVPASEDEITGKIQLAIPDSVSVYPILMDTGSSVRVLHPSGVASALPEPAKGPALEAGRPFRLGYFRFRETIVGRLEHSADSSPVGSIEWCRLDTQQEKALREALVEMRNYAASYGAQAVTGIVVAVIRPPFAGALDEDENTYELLIYGKATVMHQGEPGEELPDRPLWTVIIGAY